MNRRDYNNSAQLRRVPDHKAVVLMPIRTPERPSRNKTCPCLSGKKFKHCCKDVPTLIDTLTGKIESHTTQETPTT